VLGTERLVDQILLAFYPPHELSFDDIDMACCCVATEDVRLCLSAPAIGALVKTCGGTPPRFALTVEGEGRAVSARAELEDAWTKKRIEAMTENGRFEQSTSPDRKAVFLIHGRNDKAKREMVTFLRACGLTPIDFDDLRAELGGTVSILDVVNEGMRRAQGIVALFTPDERAVLRPELRALGDKAESAPRWQARPNVIFEAGMAFARDPDRVVFVVLGETQLFSDVAGIHLLNPGKGAKVRATLRSTLKKSLGCDVEDSSAWVDAGDFDGCLPSGRVGVTEPSEALGTASKQSGSSLIGDSAAKSVAPEPSAYNAELVSRPQELEHQFFRSRLMLYGPQLDMNNRRSHAEKFVKVRIESDSLVRSSFSDADEQTLLRAIHRAYLGDTSAALQEPDPTGIIVANTDAEYRFYRSWSWTACGVIGMGATLPMLCAAERYSVSDVMEDITRFLLLARPLIGNAEATVFLELVALDLAYQMEPSERYQTGRTGVPRAYNVGRDPGCYVEKRFGERAFARANVADAAAEMMRLALVRVHKERVDVGNLATLVQAIGLVP
jgi:predicted nucleotide-binding protein